MWTWVLLLVIINSALALGMIFDTPPEWYKINVGISWAIGFAMFWRIMYKMRQGQREKRLDEMQRMRGEIQKLRGKGVKISESGEDASEEGAN